MSRTAALALASTVVLALLGSVLAVTLQLDALRVPEEEGAPVVEGEPSDPIVRKVTRTITLHRTQEEEAEGPAPVVTVVRTGSPAPAPEATEPPKEEEGGGEPKPDNDDDEAGDKFK